MKKMRRMIPALCMLLVSAIMLTTASYAWFTMNEQVTASGMQIQAKSTGSLVVSDAPLKNDSSKTAVDLTPATVPTLKPITWKYAVGGDTPVAAGWKVANGIVDPHTGKVDGLKPEAVDISDNEYFVDKEIYIGSAGDTMYNQQLTINLSAIAGADELASKAYAIAIYVCDRTGSYWANDAVPTNSDVPTAVIHVDNYMTNADDTYTRNVIVLKGTEVETGKYTGYTIPSIVGITGTDSSNQDNTVGLKISLRFFVDGDLDALSGNGTLATKSNEVVEYPQVGTTYEYKDANNETQSKAISNRYNVNTTYYVKNADGEYEFANLADLTAEQLAGTADLPATWRVREVTYEQITYKYVNSDKVPMNGTTLSVTVSTAKLAEAELYVPTAPETPADPDNTEGN